MPSDRVVFENAMNRIFDNPLSRKLGLVSVLQQPLYVTVEQPGAGWHFGETPMKIERCCPAIGQHAGEIMDEMGFSEEEIADYRTAKIMGKAVWSSNVSRSIAAA